LRKGCGMANAEKPEVNKTRAVTDYLAANPDAAPKDVVAALKKQGVEVSPGSVYTIRWAMKKKEGKPAPQKKKEAKAEAKKPVEKPAAAAPAPAAEVNKTKAIKKYLAAHPKEAPAAVATALTAQGVSVSASYVSATKFKMKAARRAARKAAPAQAPASDTISLAALLEAKKLIAKLGSVEQAKQAIAALAQLS
jgi:hypothetical protein